MTLNHPFKPIAESPITVTVTKVVPVNDRETLEAWLTQELGQWLQESVNQDGEILNRDRIGTRVLEMLDKTGFKVEYRPKPTYRDGFSGDSLI